VTEVTLRQFPAFKLLLVPVLPIGPAGRVFSPFIFVRVFGLRALVAPAIRGLGLAVALGCFLLWHMFRDVLLFVVITNLNPPPAKR